MANFVFNIAKGRAVEKVADTNGKLGVLLLKSADIDGTLKDYDTLAALLTGLNVECNFTNYVRVTGITGTITVDDAADTVKLDIPDPVWPSAGGAVNNTTVKLIVFYEETASDAGRIPITAQDFVATTTGGDLTAQIDTSGIFQGV